MELDRWIGSYKVRSFPFRVRIVKAEANGDSDLKD